MPTFSWIREGDTGLYRVWPNLPNWPGDMFERLTKEDFEAFKHLRFITLVESFDLD